MKGYHIFHLLKWFKFPHSVEKKVFKRLKKSKKNSCECSCEFLNGFVLDMISFIEIPLPWTFEWSDFIDTNILPMVDSYSFIYWRLVFWLLLKKAHILFLVANASQCYTRRIIRSVHKAEQMITNSHYGGKKSNLLTGMGSSVLPKTWTNSIQILSLSSESCSRCWQNIYKY